MADEHGTICLNGKDITEPKVTELKKALKERGLKTSGKKLELKDSCRA
jgi:hypothetical protein